MLRDLRARDVIDWKENRRESPLQLAGELGVGLAVRSVTLASAVFVIPRGSKGGFFSSCRTIVIDMAPAAVKSCVTLLSMGSRVLGVRAWRDISGYLGIAQPKAELVRASPRLSCHGKWGEDSVDCVEAAWSRALSKLESFVPTLRVWQSHQTVETGSTRRRVSIGERGEPGAPRQG